MTKIAITQPQRGLYTRLSRPLQRLINYMAVLGTLLFIACLFPVFCSLRESPRASCLSNEKQAAIGLLLYAQDYDDQFPCGTRTNRSLSAVVKDTSAQAKLHAGQGWAGGLHPYVKYEQVFACMNVVVPDSRRGDAMGCADGREIQAWTVSYAYNRNLALNTATAKLTDAYKTVLLCEAEGASANVRDADERNPHNTYSPAGNGISLLTATDGIRGIQASAGIRYATGVLGGYGQEDGFLFRRENTADMIPPRHDTGANYVMADGHTKWLQPQHVSPGDNALHAQDGQNKARHQAAGTGNLGAFHVTFSTR